jgi:hypothetical protein
MRECALRHPVKLTSGLREVQVFKPRVSMTGEFNQFRGGVPFERRRRVDVVAGLNAAVSAHAF